MQIITKKTVSDDFLRAYGTAPDAVVSAPGRVNLIGEHTDYNDGFVLPVAIDYYTYVAYCSEKTNNLTVIAKDFENEKIVINYDAPLVFDEARSWPNYICGVVEQLLKSGFKLRGGKLLITGNVPAGAGLSSSASLEMVLINALVTMSESEIDPTQAALLGQAAENQFVGINCGIMDQLISARGGENSALLIDCQDLTSRLVPIPHEWEMLIVHSGVKRGLVDSKYNERRQQCENVARHFGVESLRLVSLEQLIDARIELEPISFKRAHHVLSENLRTLIAADALSKQDMSTLARVMAESHTSMRDDFDITTPEIDILVNILQIAGEGRAGARMTGGGFGGCVVSIAPKEHIDTLEKAVLSQYEAATHCKPTLIRAKASAGAFSL